MSSKLPSLATSSPAAHFSPKNITCKNTAIPTLDNGQEYEDIHMIKLINKAKFPVYLVSNNDKTQHYALKVFDYEDGEPHQYFENEARFAVLDHPNIIKYVHIDAETLVPSCDGDKAVSCIMMEYAPYGDFFRFIRKFRDSLNDKLIRTYFRQLIDAIEYLHTHGVCHLDLKLENLLVGKDYQLKVADFDMSYMVGDTHVLTKGTKHYRAPELKASRCRNGSAADIYSAGIILFALKTGGLIPYPEDRLYDGVDLFRLLNDNSKDCFLQSTVKSRKRKTHFLRAASAISLLQWYVKMPLKE